MHSPAPVHVPGWCAARLLSAPHRLCFFWAGIQWALAAAWWAAYLLLQALGLTWPWRVAAAHAHGLWFSLGGMPLFIAGFMFTAGPKWLRHSPIDAHGLQLAVASFTVGWAIAVVGFHAGAMLAAAGLGLAAFGWSLMAHRIVRLVIDSAQPDRRHAITIAAASVVIATCLAASAWMLALGHPAGLTALVHLGLWCGIAIVFLVVSHRMLPFLGDGAWQRMDVRWPDWPLWLVASVPLVQGVAALVDPWLGGVSAWRWAVACHLALAATLSLRLSLRWLGKPALKQPLVAMLFRALLWWDAALVLGSVSWLPIVDPIIAAEFAMAALHALTLGYMGGTLLAMATRISSTQSGRAQSIDRVGRLLHALLQVAVFARVVAALWPGSAASLLPLAALAWLAVSATWATRHGQWLGQPRVDGRPG